MKTLNAQQAADYLDVSKATLYAYVSRGLIEPIDGPNRRSSYPLFQLEQLKLKRARPRQAAQSALDWGLPSLPSQISQIRQGELLYRGRSALELAKECSLAEVAAWLWKASTARELALADAVPNRGPGTLRQMLSWLAEQMEIDHSSWTLHPEAVVKTGWNIFQTFLGALPYPDERIRQALILCADHDLTASTLSARIAASTHANPYAVVSAALATLSGSRHGGACALAEALVEEATRSTPRQALVARLKRGDALAGFGHRLYPKGDPRARLLLELSEVGQAWTEAGLEILGEHPSLDLALVLALRLPDGGAFQVFACGRVLGWIAHALEQYAETKMIRARSS